RPSSARRDTLLRMNLRLPDGRQGHLMAVQGRPLLGELMRAGIALQHLCGGHAVCATCAVQIQAGADAPPPAEDEADLLDFLGAAPGTRLACQLRLAAGFEHAQVSLPRGLLLDGPRTEATR
ncbi:2Fe-2S iron-sulfur cluster-binding protein, partial [Burkholderia gladioli]|nr:2Fe-2S iron-sulfur cluster-binding protein [Burkholderia gladioli]